MCRWCQMLVLNTVMMAGPLKSARAAAFQRSRAHKNPISSPQLSAVCLTAECPWHRYLEEERDAPFLPPPPSLVHLWGLTREGETRAQSQWHVGSLWGRVMPQCARAGRPDHLGTVRWPRQLLLLWPTFLDPTPPDQPLRFLRGMRHCPVISDG